MADKDLEGDGPSLELPSFGFGRKKRKDRATPQDVPTEEPSARTEPEPEPAPAPEPQPQPEPQPEPVPRPTAYEEPTTVLPVATTAPAPSQAPPARPAPQAPPVSGSSTGQRSDLGSTRVQEPVREPIREPAGEPAEGPARREVRFPALAPLPAVLLVGGVVGLAAVLATYGSLRLCDAATGTASCGGGPGFLMLLAILIALTYLGGWLLRGFGIGEAGSTSFLAVGLVAVVVMLFLLESLDEWWTAVVVVVVAVVAYALSWRVTTAISETDVPRE